MFDNVALNVFIGLIAIFLLYSLLASILMESVAKYLSLRSKITLKAVSKLLDDSDYTDKGVLKRLAKSIGDSHIINSLEDRNLTALFYAHPNIKNLGRNNFNRKPSSISPEMFSDTVIQILRGDAFSGQQNQIDIIKGNLKLNDEVKKGQINMPKWYHSGSNKYKPVKNALSTESGELLEINELTVYQLEQFLYDSHSDIDWFKKRLISWYNEMMERAQGWYIKQTRLILFLIGLILAISFNIDAISISKKLANDKVARDKMIEFASSLSKDSNLGAKIDTSTSNAAMREAFTKAHGSIQDAQSIIGDTLKKVEWPLAILGWLITAIAISLGAPFWFDLLGKIMAIRQSGNSATGKQKKSDSGIKNPTDQPIG